MNWKNLKMSDKLYEILYKLWKLFIILMCVLSIIVLYIQHKKDVQCTKACNPQGVIASEFSFCLCENSPNVIWRKDIK